MKSAKLKMGPGFTLIEFMLVIGMLLILTTLAVPQFASYSQRQALLVAADQLVVDLKTAQGKAKTSVQDDPTGRTVKAFSVSSTAGSRTYTLNRRFNGVSGQVSSHSLESPIVISSWPGDVAFLLPTGNLEGADRNIVVSYAGVGTYCIKVEASGRIYRLRRDALC